MRKRRRGAVIVSRPSGSAIGRQSAPVTVCVLNAAAFSGMGSIIVLELADKVAALRTARKIARETGRCVTVRDANMALIETIPAAGIH